MSLLHQCIKIHSPYWIARLAAYGCKSVLHSYPRVYQSSQLCLEALIGPLSIITLSVLLEYIY